MRQITVNETGYPYEFEANTFIVWDFQNYLLHLWHPGLPFGASCANLERFGNHGDGGKMVCDAAGVLNARDDCLIVSVGSNGDVSFEEAMRTFNLQCEVHIYDVSNGRAMHTLARAARVRVTTV